MARRTYQEKNKASVKHNIEDEKALEKFIAKLENDKEAMRVKELLESANSFEASASYELDRPYEGENFWRYSLPDNEKVSAHVLLCIEIGENEMQYEGRVYDNAYEIFQPPETGNTTSKEIKMDKGTDGITETNDSEFGSVHSN
jgi:hypothetical protein